MDWTFPGPYIHDAGDRTNLLTALGQPMRTWDDRAQRFSFTYDLLRRPVDRTVSVGGAAEQLLSRIIYGDQLPASPEATNHRGRVYRAYDGAGVATTLAFDFKGQPTSEQRQLVSSKTTRPDWSALLGQSTIADMATAAASLLDAETFSASSHRDALGRVLTAISPDNSQALYTYDEGGALQKVELKHRGSTTAQTVVGDITYNPRGQRKSVVYGPTSSPTTTTSYSQALQGLHYHYDPVGNITDIRDSAQQTVYFQNAVVDAANTYKYDAVYRLIEATGREHSTQGTSQRTHEQLPTGPQPMTSDPSAMWQYTQKYTYDSVGNILKMQHISGSSSTRYYEYAANGNQLEKTSAPGDPANGPYTHAYSYDTHGSMTVMPHLSSMVWDYDDQLQNAVAGTQSVWFQYAGGIRSRKYTESTTGSATTEERIYLGAWEIYRKRVGVGQTLDVERESLHISDGSGRICLVDTQTVGPASTVPVWRYQLGNHLGSAATEVDASGAVISYEEYHPYGTSAYRAVDASVEVSAKRYRYTGMERDEETGLAYHSARYYAAWLGRWTAADPIGLEGGTNRFAYASNRPTFMVDYEGTSERPSQDELSAYADAAASHNGAVETWHAQVRMFNPEARGARHTAARLDQERVELWNQEVALLDWHGDLSLRTYIADQETAQVRAHEEGGPDKWTLSGRTTTRLHGVTNIFIGSSLALGGGVVGGVVGADYLQAGMRQAWTGDQAHTLVRSGTELGSEALGNSVRVARIHGDMAETLAPVVVGGIQLSASVIQQPVGILPRTNGGTFPSAGSRPGASSHTGSRPISDTTTFFRGSTYGEALEVVEAQALNAERIAANQATNPGAAGSGAYITTQEATALHYAQLSGLQGRGLGPAVVKIEVPTLKWNKFIESRGIPVETPIPRGPSTGATETLIPMDLIDEFSAMATFLLHF